METELENFEVERVKLPTSRASLNIKSFYTKEKGIVPVKLPFSGEYPMIPHPDLVSLFDALKEILAEEFGYGSFYEIVANPDFKGTQVQKAYAKKYTEKMLEKIVVTGISINGKSRDSLTIMGEFEGKKIQSSPQYFSHPVSGEDLEDHARQINTEIYKYIFEEKEAQLEIAFDLGVGEDEKVEMKIG